VNGQPAAVVGVTPPGFFGLDRGVSPDVTVPLPARSPFTNLGVTAGLKPGATDGDVRAEANAALQRALAIVAPRLSKYREASRQAVLALRADLRPADKGLGIAMQSYVEPLRLLLLLSAGARRAAGARRLRGRLPASQSRGQARAGDCAAARIILRRRGVAIRPAAAES